MEILPIEGLAFHQGPYLKKKGTKTMHPLEPSTQYAKMLHFTGTVPKIERLFC